jgi:anaerobic selenocysteine-containing dehydrogenase
MVLERAGDPLEGVHARFVMNQEDGGFDCPGCAWPDDPSGLRLDICENGVKHATWELAPATADREFFAAHTVGELAGWSDYDLEAVGRLAEPLSYNPASDTYEPISWEDAFALIGTTLRGLESPDQASFYTSGRLSNEATFLNQSGCASWDEQPAGLLGHVPRGERPGADCCDRERQGHRGSARLGGRGCDLADGRPGGTAR